MASKEIKDFIEQSSPATGDWVLIQELSGNATKKTSISNLLSASGDFAVLGGKLGGQTLNGGTDTGENLTFSSTSNALKGLILSGS